MQKCAIIASTTMTADIGPRERLCVAKGLLAELAVRGSGRHILAQQMEITQRAIIRHLHPPNV